MKLLIYTSFLNDGIEEEARATCLEEGTNNEEDFEQQVENILESQRDDLNHSINELNIKKYLLIGEAERWNGNYETHGIFDKFSEIIENYEGFEISSNKKNEAVIISLFHHDGTHAMKMYSINDNVLDDDLNEFSLAKLKKHSKAITSQMFLDVMQN